MCTATLIGLFEMIFDAMEFRERLPLDNQRDNRARRRGELVIRVDKFAF